MTEPNGRDISVGIISRDPFFTFAAGGLLGRDRRARIAFTVVSQQDFRKRAAKSVRGIQVAIIDVDTLATRPGFYDDLSRLLADFPGVRVIALVEGLIRVLPPETADLPLAALISKEDLGYCLHLAIRAVIDEDLTLISEAVKPYLPEGSYLAREARTLLPEKLHPDLTHRLHEIVIWRIFIGLDNPDIEDELLIGSDTVRGYVSDAYHALGAKGEMDAFESMSEWWWTSRFDPLLR